MQLIYLLKGLELTPALVERVTKEVSAGRYDEKIDPERFSFREAVAHLADWEAINLERIRRTVEEPGCTVPGLDEGQRAIDNDYASLDPLAQAAVFHANRTSTLTYLRSVDEEDWEKVSYHSERGRQTLYELATSILGHDVVHAEQFSQYM